jgi:hypothetical protein
LNAFDQFLAAIILLTRKSLRGCGSEGFQLYSIGNYVICRRFGEFTPKATAMNPAKVAARRKAEIDEAPTITIHIRSIIKDR